MAGLWKTGLVGAAAGLALPIGGISGLLSAGFGSALLLASLGIGSQRMTGLSLWKLLTSDVMGYLILSLAVFIPTFLFLRGLQRRAKALVGDINSQRGLSLDSRDLLGYPSPGFLVFDQEHRVVASCNSVTGDYQLHDFSWIMGWRMIWEEAEQMEMNGGTRMVNASGMSVPTFDRTVRPKNFAIELQVANAERPLLTFPMSRRAAETWCARLNVLFNGQYETPAL